MSVHPSAVHCAVEAVPVRHTAMSRARALTCWLLALLAAPAHPHADDVLYTLSEAEYYEMPQLFHLDEYAGCLATRGAYCLGSFELVGSQDHQLYRRMQLVSANWVNNFNHTRVHRGLCLHRSCRHAAPRAPAAPAAPAAGADAHHDQAMLTDWFSSCVNESTWSEYNLSARLYRLDYCALGPPPAEPLTANERGFAALFAALLALAAVSTVLDLTMSDHAKKRCNWALAWSVPACWRALHAPVRGGGGGADLRAFDGLRVLCMMCVIVEHVCWLATQHYLADVRGYELMRRATDVVMMVNSTLVVQIFFLMSSFLLAHKLLQTRHRPDKESPIRTFADTLLNRIIRVSPSYWVVVWLAASWWERAGAGPQWAPQVRAEAAVCRRKWWAHMLYLNNVVEADDKCLIQTWYLAADMQLYALCLALTLLLRRGGRAAVAALAALLAATVAALAALAYLWRLVPTFVMHHPELVREIYRGESSFNVLYQSPLSNSPGALAGLLLAHVHHHLVDRGVCLNDYKVFRWVSVVSPGVAVAWAAWSPRLLGEPPGRAGAAALAAVERPLFSLFVALGLLGAMHDVKSPLRTLFSWRGWRTPARLCFGVLLLHMPLNKWLVASRLTLSHVTRQTAIFEWFGVAAVSYLCALPLAVLVELPAQRLYSALRHPRPAPAPAPATPQKLDNMPQRTQ